MLAKRSLIHSYENDKAFNEGMTEIGIKNKHEAIITTFRSREKEELQSSPKLPP